MPSISLPVALLGATAITGVAGALSSSNAAKTQANAATTAAQTEANAANDASAVQLAEFGQTQQNLAPFVQSGPNSLAALLKGVGAQAGGTGQGPLNTPYPAFDPSNLQNTPGYKFTMDQGLEALLNAKSATGGVAGGNTLKAITQYGEGLADTTYQQAFSNWLSQAGLAQSQQQQGFQQLYDVANLSENAAAGQGALAANVGSAIGSNIIGAGNASAAGTVGAATANAAGTIGATNAITGGINGLTSNYLLSSLLGGGGGSLFGGGGGGLFGGGGGILGGSSLGQSGGLFPTN